MDYSMDLGLVASSWRHVGKSGEKGKGKKLHVDTRPVEPVSPQIPVEFWICNSVLFVPCHCIPEGNEDANFTSFFFLAVYTASLLKLKMKFNFFSIF